MNLIDKNIFEIIPYIPNGKNIFAPFFTEIQNKLINNDLLPAFGNTYVKKVNAYWPKDNPVYNIFSDAQLQLLTGKNNAKWVFRDLVENSIGKEQAAYITNCVNNKFDMSAMLESITENFINQQTEEWLHTLYQYLLNTPSYWSIVKTKPIFKNQDGKAVSAFFKKDNNNNFVPILFLPNGNEDSNYTTIHPNLSENKNSLKFFIAFGIKEPDLRAEIDNIILPLYDNNDNNTLNVETLQTHFNTFLNYWLDAGKPQVFIDKLKDKHIISYRYNNNETGRSCAKDIYFFDDDLKLYFETIPSTKFVNLNINENGKLFLTNLGVNCLPKINDKTYIYYSNLNEYQQNNKEDVQKIQGVIKFLRKQNLINQNFLVKNKFQFQRRNNGFTFKYSEKKFEGLEKILSEEILRVDGFSIIHSLLVWKIISNSKYNSDYNETFEYYPRYAHSPEIKKFPSSFIQKLKTLKWLYKIDVRVAPNQILIDELDECYDKTNIDFINLLNFKTINSENEDIRDKRRTLIKDLLNNIKYSYECFKSYIDLLNTFVDRIEDTQRPKTISFQKIKVHTADNKFFTLSGPGNFISTDIENSKDLKVTLIFKDGRREIIDIESVSKKEQDLLIFCPNCISANIIAEFSNVFKIEFRFYPILDLLERLKNFFGNTDYINTWDNIQKSLPKLNYIYGPPGTGKTTTLSAKINQIITDKKDVKIIILTPTNKAADVIMKKIYEFEKENSYIYARRFSRPTDPDLKDEIYVEIIDNNVNVIISTIHKLLYLNNNNEQLLQQNWDYVIFDESSMIDLQYIVFAIMAFYKRNKNTIYYVAGDPKQIPPVNNIDDNEYEDFDLQDENIYKMMGLDSFAENKQNIREHDTIQNLTTQYRSIPQIGELFSKISYSGLLKHGRTTNETNPKKLPDGFLNNLILSNISFINIPLKKDNSLFNIYKLNYSSYHIYCSILVAEIIKHFELLNNNTEQQWSIGLIAPYKAQATILNRLILSYRISEKIKIYSDTVHGFQGDECDIIFFICNPNNYKFTGNNKSLLSKEYIYNVAISRAKDYLFVLHPFYEIENNDFINQIVKNSDNKKYTNTNEIEKILFKDENFIEKNSYISAHDSVNVYSTSEIKYFIKISDTAIDLQLNF